MIIYNEGFIELDTKLKVFYRFWKSENTKKYIIGIHGFAEHSGRYDEFSRNLAKNGFSVIMYDLRGHGKSSTSENIGYIKNFDEFINDTFSFIEIMGEKLKNNKFVLYGHSMGGLILLKYATKYNENIDGLISSGPATIMNVNSLTKTFLTLMAKISPKSRVKLPIKPEFLTHEQTIWEAYINDPLVFKRPTVNLIYEMYKGSKSIWKDLNKINVPILMLHGGEDKIVPKVATELAFEKISSKDKAKKIYQGMYHEIHNELDRNIVYNDISEWLKFH
ncbi:MAG: lysophospholipase [Thermoplasmata archaeon]